MNFLKLFLPKININTILKILFLVMFVFIISYFLYNWHFSVINNLEEKNKTLTIKNKQLINNINTIRNNLDNCEINLEEIGTELNICKLKETVYEVNETIKDTKDENYFIF